MSTSARWYQRMLRFAPRPLQREYRDDMVAAFERLLVDVRADGRPLPLVRVWLRVLADLGSSSWHSLRGHSPVFRIPPKKPTMESRLQDARFALRVMVRQPLFTIVAIATIAVGISATASIFSIANGLLIRAPEGVRDGSDLVSVHRIGRDSSGFHSFSLPAYRHLAAAHTGLVQLAAYDNFGGSLVLEDAPYRVMGTVVSANYFETVGARPGLGRLFYSEEDDVPGRDLVAVISDRTWEQRFDRDPSVIGRAITLNGHGFTIVGVTEPGFVGHLAAFVNEVWVTLSAQALVHGTEDLSEDEAVIGVELVGRLAAGANTEIARQGLDRAGSTFHETRDTEWFGADVIGYAPIIPVARGGLTIFLTVMFAIAGVLLTITAVNVANMMLARAATRSREVGVRLALGATRRRLVTQLLIESVMLFVAGGALGTLLTVWLMGLLGGISLPLPILIDLHFAPDLRVLLFALGVAGVAGIVFGLSPALHATRGDLVSALKDGTQPRRKRRLRSVLVTTQVAGSAVLLIVAGLLIRSADRATAVDVGMDINDVYAFILDTNESNRSEQESFAFFQQLEAEAARTPGVESVGSIDVAPLTGSNRQSTLVLPDLPPERGLGFRVVESATVSPGYLETMRIPLVAGRGLLPSDTDDTPLVVLVNEHLARTFFPGEDVIGKQVGFRTADEPIYVEIVGVMRDTKIRTPGDEPRPLVYVHWAQFPSTSLNVLARTSQPESAVAIRDIVQRLDPVLPPATPVHYAELVGLALLPVRIAMILATVFGAAGLLLASLGLYGLLAFSVAQRSGEIGVRMALGAPGGSVRRLVVRDGLRLTVVGLTIGLLAGAGLGQALRWMLFGLSPVDPVTFVTIPILMLTIAGFACWLPARRAAATDPVQALRAE